SGVICVPMPGTMLDRLEIPLMTPHNKERMRTAYTISVDARDGISTGISAADRAHTARVLADSATEPWEITRPGHVFPLRYREGGVLVRRGHTEAAVDLARMAGLTPAGVLVEVVNDDGTMKRAGELREFADEHGLAAKLQAYQLQDGGRDTVDANLDLGLPADARHYGTATQILRDLGVAGVRLMTNNPDKVTNLEDYGVHVAERVPLTPRPNDHN